MTERPKTKAARVSEARAALAAAKSKQAALQEKAEAAAKQQPVIAARLARVRSLAGRRPVCVQRPGETKYAPKGINLGRAYTSAEDRQKYGTNLRKWVEAAVKGEVKIEFASVVMSVRGFAQRTRYITRDDVRKIEALKRREEKARDAWVRAGQATRSAILAAWEAGEKVPVEDVAHIAGAMYQIAASQVDAPSSWTMDWAKSDVEKAQRHLDAVLGKEDAVCGCRECVDQRALAAEKAKTALIRKVNAENALKSRAATMLAETSA